jgi:hypothetical protein
MIGPCGGGAKHFVVVLCVNVGAPIEELVDDADVALLRRIMESGPAILRWWRGTGTTVVRNRIGDRLVGKGSLVKAPSPACRSGTVRGEAASRTGGRAEGDPVSIGNEAWGQGRGHLRLPS